VGFAVPNAKSGKTPELARWSYRIKINVEETCIEAQKSGFHCRPLEGQPKNKKGKNGWGEPYPLGQYEITGGNLSQNTKIHISPKTTQFYLFGNEISKPSIHDLETFEPFFEELSDLANNLEKAEELMNRLSSFPPNEKERFDCVTRTQAKVPAMYRLKITSDGTFQELLDDLMNKFYGELNKIIDDMLQNMTSHGFNLADQRLQTLTNEMVFFQRNLIKLGKEWKNPNAQKWEDDLNKSLKDTYDFRNQFKKNISKYTFY
jgi:hypothetical protein